MSFHTADSCFDRKAKIIAVFIVLQCNSKINETVFIDVVNLPILIAVDVAHAAYYQTITSTDNDCRIPYKVIK